MQKDFDSIGRANDLAPLNSGFRAKPSRYTVVLAGNPNTGKSTVFNNLTGLNQHTGNWPGKTVALAKGAYRWANVDFTVVDLPGTYSLSASSRDEEVASSFIRNGVFDAIILVSDATCLERNLSLALQIMEMTSKVVVCLNLMDEAEKRGFRVNVEALEKELGVPVVPCVARQGIGMDRLKDTVLAVARRKIIPKPVSVMHEAGFGDGPDLGLSFGLSQLYESSLREEDVTAKIHATAQEIATRAVTRSSMERTWYERADDVLTSKTLGIPIMLVLLAGVFWITLSGANVPSRILSKALFKFQENMSEFMIWVGAPEWLHGILILGAYRTCAWVVSVMLPPMAIFFPMFTLLEDLGYLPRVAFNLDYLFKKAGAHGKQSLTMSMGLGCNAVGVVAARIIESPRERLVAIITNVFMPCNGRFPTMITLSSIFLTGAVFQPEKGMVSALTVLTLVLCGFIITLIVSKLLSSTILSGVPSAFILEMPSYRPPQVLRVLLRSILDRTIYVLGRAAVMAAPAGALIWILANSYVKGVSLLAHAVGFLSPLGRVLGLDGTCLLAFILGFPANEIVLPVAVMSYSTSGILVEMGSLEALREILMTNGWTVMTAISFMLFSLLHWPCSTTLWTIKKETGSWKWTMLAAVIPTLVAIIVILVVRGGILFAKLVLSIL